MREKLKKIASTAICCMLFAAMLLSSWKFLMRKGSYVKNEDFYSYEGDYDVLFLGTSHVVMGVSPMELWKDYGIVSYNLANHGQWIPIDYWVLKNALDYTKPKLVVLDIRAIDIENNKVSPEHAAQTHESFDRMPLSRNKIAAIYDLFPKGERMEYLFDFSIYHTRWKEIDQTFFEEALPSEEKGADLDNSNNFDQTKIYELKPPKIYDKSEMNAGETVGKEYLRKIIELCREEGIEILLTSLPYAPNHAYQKWLNSAQAIADEYGVPYLDMIVEDTFVNYHTDFFDEDHLNSSGAKKTTKELGRYLKENFDLPDHRDGEAAEKWNQDYEDYKAHKVEALKLQKSLDTYLMLLADDDFDAVIEIYNPRIWKDSHYVHLFENLGVDGEQVTKDTDLIVIKEAGKSVDMIENFHDSEGVTETSAGQIGLFIEEMDEEDNVKSYGVYLDDEKRYTAGLLENAGIRILVLDKDTGETADMVTFSYTVKNQKNYKLKLMAINGEPVEEE